MWTWLDAINGYSYPVDLRRFEGRHRFGSEWFNLNMVSGNREETIQFEDRFRAQAQTRIEPWYEVVYWKMASQGGRADYRTNDLVEWVVASRVKAEELWKCCLEYVHGESKGLFRDFQKLLFVSQNIAVAYTFPAFVCPDRFPMVDTRIARYVALEGESLGLSGQHIERTLQRFQRPSPSPLTLQDWPFVQEWTNWCRRTAQKLNGDPENSYKLNWRARDVEMAVFQSWGDRTTRSAQSQPLHRLPRA